MRWSLQALAPLLLLMGCDAPIAVEGLELLAEDAIYARVELGARPGALRETTVLISNAQDLCGLLEGEEGLFGLTLLQVKHRSTGSAQMRMARYDRDCQMIEQDRADDGWASVDASDLSALRVDFAFFGQRHGITGRATARYCAATRALSGCYLSSMSR